MKITKLSQKGLELIKSNRFYVYEHLKPNTGEVFYIGRGTKNRAYQTRSRNNHWANIVKKHGLEVNIVYKNLTSSEANQKEIELIDFYGFYNLCNMTSGGDANIVFKKETINKMSLAKFGNKNAFGHKCLNLENKEKMKHYGNTFRVNTKHSLETKQQIAKSKTGQFHTKESKIKQSESLKLAYLEGRKQKHNLGKIAWNYGISPSAETLEKQRLKKLGVKRKPHTEETKAKMRLKELNRKNNGNITKSA
jgi:hypothetical protein